MTKKNDPQSWEWSKARAKAATGPKSGTTTKNRKAIRRPIAEKLVQRLPRHMRSEAIDLTATKESLRNTMPFLERVASESSLQDLHPAHACYVLVQNELSRLVEQLTRLPELDRFSRAVSLAEDEYLPSGPPMSPLTHSFFNSWAFFDLGVGAGRETLGTISLAVGKALGMGAEFERVLDLFQDSAMGVFEHEGVEGEILTLRELVTGRVCRAICPSGYRGVAGQLLYARVLPPPLPQLEEHVVFTTPYRLLAPGKVEWQAYFDRTLPEGPPANRLAAHRTLMKWGPAGNYWSEFVFEAYMNHRPEVIFLAGLPDVSSSRPHSPDYRK
ncbi:hypothetical protein Poly30_10660 [Planctomycetes bacterium Poly30]|uniref:Uncharacterized protein n=1 Tax=Saltatorellus ferox TaxID=2528018 RepID=A0A518EN97_9BACT|nr:hypothetical protein Poly30_10660 [Planctomycetes bacterium Poly30]